MTSDLLYTEILETVVEEMRYEYSGKEIEEMDEMDLDEKINDLMLSTIDNMVIYTYKCQEICNITKHDVFEEHDIWGKAENWSQAAYAALYDVCMEENYLMLDAAAELKRNEKSED